jgi:delta-aminolevulinic acid dehydratase/porphobilinogen synthase
MQQEVRHRLVIENVINSLQPHGGLPEGQLLVVSSQINILAISSSLILQQRDANEGADIIMVKPAMPYLDVISDAAELTPDHPIACYQVSGEFAMVHAGAAAGVYDLKTMAFESVEGMVRAGRCFDITME